MSRFLSQMTPPEARREWSVPADPRSVAVIRAGVREFARDLGAEDEVLSAIALAVSEAVTNSVVHAYVGQEPGTIQAVARAGRDEIVVRVTDDGRGMQPRPDSPGLGMGLPLIGQMTASVDIRERQGESGTEVCMTFSVPGVDGPESSTSDPTRVAVLEAVTHLARSGGWPSSGVERLADLVVPAVADGCALDLLDDEDRPHRLTARAIGAGGEDLSDWVAEQVASVDDIGSPPEVALRTRSTRVASLDPETLATAPHGADVEIARHLGVRWRIITPVQGPNRVYGLLLLGLRAERGEPGPEMIRFAEAVAERIAEALGNKRLIAELRRTRTRFERILGALGEAVTVHDREGRTVYANQAAADLLGYPTPEAVLESEPGEIAARYIITREDGSPVETADLPGRRLLAGLDAPPLLTRSVERTTGRVFWMVTKATQIDDGEDALAVNVIDDVTEAKNAEHRLRFLADASARLSATLDYERTLTEVARLAVPEIADWCAVDLLTTDGELQRMALAHVDPAKLDVGRLIHERYPPDLNSDQGLGPVLRGGPSVVWPEIDDAMLEHGARSPEHLALLRQIGLRSALIAPMRVRERTIGVLSWVQAESGRRFTAADVGFAELVARRAAVAVENARLYTELAAR